MKNHNPANERIKRKYFTFLKEAKRYDEQTVDTVAKALNRFEVFTRYRDFKAFHSHATQAIFPLAGYATGLKVAFAIS